MNAKRNLKFRRVHKRLLQRQRLRRKKQVEEEEEQRYANIPPKHVRKKRETEMRKAYDEMLAVEDGRKGKKKKTRQREELDDDFFDELEEEEKMSKAPIIVLGDRNRCSCGTDRIYAVLPLNTGVQGRNRRQAGASLFCMNRDERGRGIFENPPSPFTI